MFGMCVSSDVQRDVIDDNAPISDIRYRRKRKRDAGMHPRRWRTRLMRDVSFDTRPSRASMAGVQRREGAKRFRHNTSECEDSMIDLPQGSPSTISSHGDAAEDFDVIIIGAGISGIGAAYRIAERNPGLRYVILERRPRIGGTWDVFRYPGVRCDTSMYALCFPWEPWTRTEAMADGEQIREYITATAHKHGIDQHIRFNTNILGANWDSSTATWTVQADGAAETPTEYRARFVFFGTGYYDYDEAYTPHFPGIEQFAGTVVHPQHWPEDLGLHRQGNGGHRQRRHRGDNGPHPGEEGSGGDHAAALTQLPALTAEG